jgi:hypothetical protein
MLDRNGPQEYKASGKIMGFAGIAALTSALPVKVPDSGFPGGKYSPSGERVLSGLT